MDTGVTPKSAKKSFLHPDNEANTPEIRCFGKVLLVDDDKIVLTITSEMLSMLGFEVLKAMDGLEAVEIFKQHKEKIRFVVSDYAMPRMNGLEMLTTLRQITPGIPVIIASGYSKEQVINIAHPEPLHAFLVKPYGLPELKEVIRLSLAEKKKGQLSKNESFGMG
jgi:CheY-like chemotaxis protein